CLPMLVFPQISVVLRARLRLGSFTDMLNAFTVQLMMPRKARHGHPCLNGLLSIIGLTSSAGEQTLAIMTLGGAWLSGWVQTVRSMSYVHARTPVTPILGGSWPTG